MEQIILTKNNNTFELSTSSGLNFETGIPLIMNGLVQMFRNYVKQMEPIASDKQLLHETMYDKFDALFAKALADIFPDIKPREFDLLTAAIVKAQDDIINMASEEGITYEQALDKYNQISNDYIAKKRAGQC